MIVHMIDHLRHKGITTFHDMSIEADDRCDKKGVST